MTAARGASRGGGSKHRMGECITIPIEFPSFWRVFGGREAVGEDRGGVTGALFEMRRGGRVDRLRRKGRRQAGLTLWLAELSRRLGLGKDDDEGLAW